MQNRCNIYQWIFHWNIHIQPYCFYLLMHEIEIQKIAAFSDIQFSTKNLFLFCCLVCKYSTRNTFNESVLYTMENELIENVRPTMRWFSVFFEEDEGKFTTYSPPIINGMNSFPCMESWYLPWSTNEILE